MTDVIGQLSAADPELGHATDPVRPPAELLASVMDGTDTAMLPSEIDLVASPRRRPRPWLAVFASFAAVLVFGAVAFLAINTKPSESDGDVASTPGVLITSEMILEDGVVTEAEYRAGAEAVVACLAEVGGDASVDYDEGGYAGFGVESGAGPLDEAGLSVVERCAETHLGDKVFFLRGVHVERSTLRRKRLTRPPSLSVSRTVPAGILARFLLTPTASPHPKASRHFKRRFSQRKTTGPGKSASTGSKSTFYPGGSPTTV